MFALRYTAGSEKNCDMAGKLRKQERVDLLKGRRLPCSTGDDRPSVQTHLGGPRSLHGLGMHYLLPPRAALTRTYAAPDPTSYLLPVYRAPTRLHELLEKLVLGIIRVEREGENKRDDKPREVNLLEKNGVVSGLEHLIERGFVRLELLARVARPGITSSITRKILVDLNSARSLRSSFGLPRAASRLINLDRAESFRPNS